MLTGVVVGYLFFCFPLFIYLFLQLPACRTLILSFPILIILCFISRVLCTVYYWSKLCITFVAIDKEVVLFDHKE